MNKNTRTELEQALSGIEGNTTPISKLVRSLYDQAKTSQENCDLARAEASALKIELAGLRVKSAELENKLAGLQAQLLSQAGKTASLEGEITRLKSEQSRNAARNDPGEFTGSFYECFKQLSERQSLIFATGSTEFQNHYRIAMDQGITAPVLFTLDLEDKIALAIAKDVNPSVDPIAAIKDAHFRERETGEEMLATLRGVTDASRLAKSLQRHGFESARRIRTVPPEGTVWCVVVSEGKTAVLLVPVEFMNANSM